MKRIGLIVVLIITQNTFSQNLVELYQKVNSSVVVIETQRAATAGAGDKQKINTTSGQGSGVLISDDGYIWTASHVVNSVDFVAVKFNDDDIYMAKVISSNALADVALLKIDGAFLLKNKHVAKIANSDSVMVGEDIFVIGAPHGLEQSLSRGIVSGKIKPESIGENFIPIEYIQTDAAINPGNSGGPMFNMNGEVIGIASFILSESGGFDGIGFGATSNIAQKVLMNDSRMWFGIESILLTNELAEVFNIPQAGGLLLQTVSSEGLAAKMGLKGGFVKANIEGVDLLIGGDIILEMAGIKLVNQAESIKIRKKLTDIKQGEEYHIKYLRAGKVYEIAATVN